MRMCVGLVLVVGIIGLVAIMPCWPFRPGLKSVHGVFSSYPGLRGLEFARALEVVLSGEGVRHIRTGDSVYVTYNIWKDDDMISEYSYKAIAEARSEFPGYNCPVQIIYLSASTFNRGLKPTNNLDNLTPQIEPKKK